MYYAQRGLIRIRLLQDVQARQDFEACVRLDPLLKPNLEELIAKVKKSMADAKTEAAHDSTPTSGGKTPDGKEKKSGT